MPGCMCDQIGTPSYDKCTCCSKPFLDENTLKFSMEKLKKKDPEWYHNIHSGHDWEILSYKMDIEEPNAAHIIALALNNKNKVALKTAHLEMMRTLKLLCKPDPTTLAIPWILYEHRC